jgi:hypothetical protein
MMIAFSMPVLREVGRTILNDCGFHHSDSLVNQATCASALFDLKLIIAFVICAVEIGLARHSAAPFARATNLPCSSPGGVKTSIGR